jgi:hypothetical protein
MGFIVRSRSRLGAVLFAADRRSSGLGSARRLAVLVAVGLLFAATQTGSAAAASPCGSSGIAGTQSGSETCIYSTAGSDTFTVPPYVPSVTFTLYGGSVIPNFNGIPNPEGLSISSSFGGMTEGTLVTSAGEAFDINVGGPPTGTTNPDQTRHPAVGGVNGGGNGGGGDEDPAFGPGGSGGAGGSDVRTDGGALTDRVLIAGGAGGFGVAFAKDISGSVFYSGMSAGGSGGGSAGVSSSGGGGNQQGGGPAGAGGGLSDPFSSGFGYGGAGDPSGSGAGGGGGGGGYYGGGGGLASDGSVPGGGGGGGSGYVTPNATNATTVTGGASVLDSSDGTGEVVASYSAGATSATEMLTPGQSSPVAAGTVAHFAVSVITSNGLPAQGTVQLEDYTQANGSTDPSAPANCPCFGEGQTVLENGTGTFTIDTSTLSSLHNELVATYEDQYQALPDVTAATDLEIEAMPTVTFTSTAPTDAFSNGPTYTVSASDSDGYGDSLPVSFSTDPSPSSVCSVSGSTVSFLTAGTCVIEATQAATADEPAAYALQSITVVAGMAQAITFTSSPPAVVTVGNGYHVSATGGGSGQPVILTASGGCSFPDPTETGAGNVTFNANEPCRITANQASGNGFTAAPQAVEEIEAQQILTFLSTPPGSPKIGDTYLISAGSQVPSVITFSVDADSTGCSLLNDETFSDQGSFYESQTVSFTGSGTCIIDANAPDYFGAYTAAKQVQQSIVIAAATQTITFTSSAPSAATYGGSYSPTATGGGSDEPVTFSSTTPAVCAVSNGVVSFGGVGPCTIDADQAATTGYAQATTQTQTFAVSRATLTVTPSPAAMTYGGNVPTISPSYMGFVNGDSASSLSTAPMCSTSATSSSTVAGSPYGASCSGAVDPDYTVDYAPGFVAVTPAKLTITASNTSSTYGQPIPAVTASYHGFVNGDSAASLTTPPSCGSFPTGPGTFVTSCAGAVDKNYTITYVNGTATVAKAQTMLVAAPASSLLIIQVRATLTRSADHTAIGGASIVFSVSGHGLCTATTNSSGVATCTVIGIFLGPNSYQATYAGNTDYASTTATGALQL